MDNEHLSSARQTLSFRSFIVINGNIASVSFPILRALLQIIRIAEALKRRGFNVHVLISQDFEHHVKEAGFPYVTYEMEISLVGNGALKLAGYFLSKTEAIWERLEAVVSSISFDAVLYDSFCMWGYYLAKTRNVPAITLSTGATYNSENFIREYIFAPEQRFFAMPDQVVRSWWEYYGRSYRLFKKTGVKALKPLDLFTGEGDLQFCSSVEELAYKMPGVHWIGIDIENQAWELGVEPEWLEGDLVFISFGTVSFHTIEFYQSAANCLGGKPYKVLIASKLAASQLIDVPSNVKICPFINQIEVLKKAKVFVSHCGIDGLFEAASCGVPIVARPEKADQYLNATKLKKLGGCIWPNRETFIEELPGAIETLLTDPSYSANMRRLNSFRENAGGPTRAAEIISRYLLG
jgi:MGT family glycosyltransferase